MTGRFLGKIIWAEYGMVPDCPLWFGLQLLFKLGDSSYIDCGGKYTENIGEACEWTTEERQCGITKSVDEVHKILKDAKVDYVSQLVGKPVEVEIDGNTFRSFRILTEVL